MLPGFIYGSAHNNHKIQSRFNRSASIVLATDNVVSGKQTYSLKQALDLTKQAKITVDGLYSGAKQNENDDATLEMKQLIESHGGIFLSQRNSDSVINLVKEIEKDILQFLKALLSLHLATILVFGFCLLCLAL